MIPYRQHLLALLLLTTGCTVAHKTTESTNWKQVSILVYTKNGKGYVHTNIPAANASFQQLGAAYGFKVTISDNPADLNPDLHVLMVHDLSTVKDTAKPVFYGNTFPSVWCHEFDGGRGWYTSLGHDSATYTEKAFQQHLIGGLHWVIGSHKALDYSKAHARSPNDPLPY